MPNIQPEVVADIGANIGVVSVMMAHNWPNAKILAFEPEPENFKILMKNVSPYPNIQAYNVGLGAETRKMRLYHSDHDVNLGGFSIKHLGINKEKYQEVQICKARDTFRSITTKLDFIKIDAEGAEYDVFKSIEEFLPGVKAIMGEAHGIDDFKMFDLLSNHFDVAISKHMGQRTYPFSALRKDSCGQ